MNLQKGKKYLKTRAGDVKRGSQGSDLNKAISDLQSAYDFNATSLSINAAGAAQGSATLITTGIAVVGAANGALGVRLPLVEVGHVVYIYNITAAQDLKVYPSSGQYINAAAQNASVKFSHATDVSVVVCTRSAAANWKMVAIHGTIS